MSESQQFIPWDELILSIFGGDCILMLGPDAITESIGGRNVSLMRRFSDELCRQLPSDQPVYAHLSPAQVAQVFKDSRDPLTLRFAAEKFFGPRRDTTSPPLRDLAELPFKLVIDTTPLNQMEHAFEDAGKPPIEDWYHRNDKERPLDSDFTISNPFVYHIFGSTKDLKSLVLAESDFIDLLVSTISGNPKLPNRLLNAFSFSSTDASMLFLGFGVRHLLLRILLYVLNSWRWKNRSFALERFEESLDLLSVAGTKLFFQPKEHHIDFIDMELGDFTRELRERYVAYEKSHPMTPQAGLKSSQVPLVFLSYCHEDMAAAERIRAALERREINVWIDYENLRVGERWSPAIERVIHDVNYFVVLNSKTLAAKQEGYVINEIHFALKREQGIRVRSFVCPVQIDEADLLLEFKEFHRIDVRTEAGLDQLSTHLKREYQQLKKTIP